MSQTWPNLWLNPFKQEQTSNKSDREVCSSKLFNFSIWGDFLRSVPCVTVWHQKIKFYTVSAGEKSLKTYLVYVPMITKNCRGHLPDRSYLDTRIVHVTQWRFWENISKKHFLDKKIHISTYKMHFRVVVAVNLKSFTFCNSNIHVTQWQSHTVTFSVNECLDLPKVNISQKFKFWFWLWWHCRFWILINVCKLYKCKIISPNHPKILLGTNFH